MSIGGDMGEAAGKRGKGLAFAQSNRHPANEAVNRRWRDASKGHGLALRCDARLGWGVVFVRTQRAVRPNVSPFSG